MLYSSVWIRDGALGRAVTQMTQEGLNSNFATFQAQGFRPICVSGSFLGNEVLYSAAWINDPQPQFTTSLFHDVPAPEFEQLINNQRAQGFRTIWVSGCTRFAQVSYSSIWINDGRGWATNFGDNDAAFLSSVEQRKNLGLRPLCLTAASLNKSPLRSTAWVNDGASWQMRNAMTEQQFQENFNQFQSQGFFPISISQYDTPNEILVDGVWLQAQVDFVARIGVADGPMSELINQLQQQNYRPICISSFQPEIIVELTPQ